VKRIAAPDTGAGDPGMSFRSIDLITMPHVRLPPAALSGLRLFIHLGAGVTLIGHVCHNRDPSD